MRVFSLRRVLTWATLGGGKSGYIGSRRVPANLVCEAQELTLKNDFSSLKDPSLFRQISPCYLLKY